MLGVSVLQLIAPVCPGCTPFSTLYCERNECDCVGGCRARVAEEHGRTNVEDADSFRQV